MSFIAGQYLVTNTPPAGAATSVGQIKEGIRLDHVVFKRKITGDNFAQTDQDAVFRGQNVFISYTLLEYNAAGAAGVFWPYGTTYLSMGIVGRLDSALAGSVILTALVGTPAAAAPATVTLGKTILVEGFPVSLLFAPDLREVPIRQQCYPAAVFNNNNAANGPSGATFGTLT